MIFSPRSDYVELNYIKAKQNASQLEEYAAELENLSNGKLEDSLGKLSSDWKGDSASAFLGKGRLKKEEILKIARDLRKTASVVRSTAERTYRAEMRARSIGLKRSYK